MPLFPKIASPCPYVNRLSEIMDGDVCRMCERRVFDLTAMSDRERLAFVAGCESDVCVSYSIPVRPTLRALAVAAAIAAPSMAAARPQPQVSATIMVPVAGGLPPAPQVQMVDVPRVATPSDLPALYEGAPEPGPTAPGKATGGKASAAKPRD